MLDRVIPFFLLSCCIGMTGCGTDEDVLVIGSATACDATVSKCSVDNGVYSLVLELGPEVKPLQPFSAKLKLGGAKAIPQSVVADFVMENMDMGINRYRLKNVGDSWDATVTLPICTASRTDWVAIIEFVDNNRKYVAKFPFHADAK